MLGIGAPAAFMVHDALRANYECKLLEYIRIKWKYETSEAKIIQRKFRTFSGKHLVIVSSAK